MSSNENEKGVTSHGWSNQEKFHLIEALKRNHSCNIEIYQKSVPSKTADEGAPHGWSREEKFLLLEALKQNHSSNIEKIQQMVPSKPVEEIKDVIAFHKTRAQNHPLLKTRKKMTKKGRWAKLLTIAYAPPELCEEAALCVRTIAESKAKTKHLPSGRSLKDEDFKEISEFVYCTIAEATGLMRIHYLKEDPILEKCIRETAEALIGPTSFGDAMDDINLSLQEIGAVPTPTDDELLADL